MYFSPAPIISYPQEENIVFSSQSSPEHQKTHPGYLQIVERRLHVNSTEAL